jgi:hypothetical protein
MLSRRLPIPTNTITSGGATVLVKETWSAFRPPPDPVLVPTD